MNRTIGESLTEIKTKCPAAKTDIDNLIRAFSLSQLAQRVGHYDDPAEACINDIEEICYSASCNTSLPKILNRIQKYRS